MDKFVVKRSTSHGQSNVIIKNVVSVTAEVHTELSTPVCKKLKKMPARTERFVLRSVIPGV